MGILDGGVALNTGGQGFSPMANPILDNMSGVASNDYGLALNTQTPFTGLGVNGLNPGSGGGIFGLSSGTIDGLKLGFGGLQTLGSLFLGLQGLNLANDQFNFQKQITNTNLANQIKSYNTRLSDIATARGFTQGQTQQQINDYITKNSLSR
jgi:hypothetical protein